MKHLFGLATACLTATSAVDIFHATCTDQNTLNIFIDFFRIADVTDLIYGTCTEESTTGVTGLTQDANFNFNITLDMSICGMDNTLEALSMVQEAFIRIGKVVTDMNTGSTMKLGYETFEIDSVCTIETDYEVIFDYGNLTIVENNLNETTGQTTVQFVIKAYDDTYTSSNFEHSRVAGNFIYLGITVLGSFDYCQLEFVPTGCAIVDTLYGFEYTMFNSEINGGCSNPDVDLTIGYDADKQMWQLSHILFLLGDTDESSFQLKCNIRVCEIAGDTSCDDIRTECSVSLAVTDGSGCNVTTTATNGTNSQPDPPSSGDASDNSTSSANSTDTSTGNSTDNSVTIDCTPEANWYNDYGGPLIDPGTNCDDTYDAVMHYATHAQQISGEYDTYHICGDLYMGFEGNFYKSESYGYWRDSCCPHRFAGTADCVDDTGAWTGQQTGGSSRSVEDDIAAIKREIVARRAARLDNEN